MRHVVVLSCVLASVMAFPSHEAVNRRAAEATDTTFYQLFNEIDENSDSIVEIVEFLKFYGNGDTWKMMNLMTLFSDAVQDSKVDVNGNNKVEPNEFGSFGLKMMELFIAEMGSTSG